MKVTGSNITITDSVVNKMQILPLGNCEQDGLPTPDNPIDVKVVTGDNDVVVQNKNLLDKSYALIGYTISNNTGELTPFNTNSAGENYIPVLPNTSYTFSANTNINTIRLSEYQIDKTHIKRNYEERSNYVTITTTANTYYIRWSLNYDNIVMTQAMVDSLNLQIEKGSTATSYVVHQEQSYTLHLGALELCKIGDYQDVITGTKDNWKVVKNIGKIDLNDLEYSKSLNLFSTNTIPNIKYVPNNQTLGVGLAEKYKLHIGSGMSSSDALNCIAIDVSQVVINTLENKPSGLFYYALAEQTETAITDTTLINELNELQDLLSYDGTTNITITSDSSNAQMLVEVTYTSESDMNEKLTYIFDKIKSKLYHIIRAL